MASDDSFGARYRALHSAHERLELERVERQRAAFTEMDEVLDAVVLSGLRGERVIEVVGNPREAEVRLPALTDSQRHTLAEHLETEVQQERGVWYLPQSATLEVGVVHLGYWGQTATRYLVTMSSEERATTELVSPDAIAVWAVLEPLFEDLALPLRLRAGRWGGRAVRQQPAVKQSAAWTKTIAPTYEALGFGEEAVDALGPGTGWDELDPDAVIERRAALLSGWAEADAESAQRLRAYRTGLLVERYYAKSMGGRVLRKIVMNDKDAQRILSAYFGGDWLALLDYLGEEPHADEEVTHALPQPRLMVPSPRQTETVAAAQGVSAEEVNRILAAYWRQSDPTSPIERRVNALKRLWSEFDAIHAQQAPGMKELVVRLDTDDVGRDTGRRGGGRGDHRLSSELREELRQLWPTTLNPRFPEQLITEPSPGLAAARAFGPAYSFWDYAGTNAWHATEGGRAYKELGDEFEHAVREMTAALAALGCPLDEHFLADLRAVEAKLGPIEQLEETVSEESEDGFSIVMTASRGERRGGYEMVRDVLTRHRRAWAEKYLTAYLEARWKGEFQGAGEAYHRHAADRGKPPTVKQFAKMAAPAAANWFAGDLTAVYNVLGLRSPLPPTTYQRCIPKDTATFVKRLRELLRTNTPAGATTKDAVWVQNSTQFLGQHALDWLNMMEVLGRPPELAEFSNRDYFKRIFNVLAPDVDDAWRIYSDAIEQALGRITGISSDPITRIPHLG